MAPLKLVRVFERDDPIELPAWVCLDASRLRLPWRAERLHLFTLHRRIRWARSPEYARVKSLIVTLTGIVIREEGLHSISVCFCSTLNANVSYRIVSCPMPAGQLRGTASYG
jgi:hypothetical protein